MSTNEPHGRHEVPAGGNEKRTAAGVDGTVYSLRLADVASRAKRLRAEQGIPEPNARQLDW